MERTAIDIIDQLDWRLGMLQWALFYAGTEEGRSKQEEILHDAGMLVLSIRDIVKATSGGGEG